MRNKSLSAVSSRAQCFSYKTCEFRIDLKAGLEDLNESNVSAICGFDYFFNSQMWQRYWLHEVRVWPIPTTNEVKSRILIWSPQFLTIEDVEEVRNEL